MTQIPILRTQRLELRPFTLNDAEAFHPLVSDPQILRFTGEQPQTSLEQVREIIRTRLLADYQRYGYGRMACIELASGRLIGFSGLKYLDDLLEVDIGYRFLPDCWGKGYATESSQCLMDYGFKQLGLTRIIGLVMPDNRASAAVLHKIGLQYEGKVRVDDCEVELDLYARSVTERDPLNSADA